MNKKINEGTTSSSDGAYKGKLNITPQDWKENQLKPYTIRVSDFLDNGTSHDFYDGKLKKTKSEITKDEKLTKSNMNKVKDIRKKIFKEDFVKDEVVWPKQNSNMNEATTSGTTGKYKVPLNLAPHIWDEHTVAPFDIPVSQYVSSTNAYDSYDGEMESSKQQINKNERIALKKAEFAKKNFTQNDDSGNPFNGYDPSAVSQPGTPEYIKKQAHLPKKDYENIMIKEDLAVWFGTKKKPKGSKQPKGPWVNICRKKEGGGHPPCGRAEGESKAYPKCRAAGVASKMTDAQKKAACAQKRAAEKKNPKVGKGNKPTMVSYKPKKKNEGLRNLITKVLRESI